MDVKVKPLTLTGGRLFQGASMFFNAEKTKIKLGETNANRYVLTDNSGLRVAKFEVWDWWDGKNISGLEIFDPYKRQRLSYEILDYAVNEIGVRNLAVEKANLIAKHVYDKFGFEITEEDETRYYMSLVS